MRQILEDARKLICNDGEVCLWWSESPDGACHFAAKDDAQKYIELRNQWRREMGWEEESYSIGTEEDFMAAAKMYEADKKANEVKDFCKHADALIERRKLEIKALDGLIQVCRKFDGKVVNKRFHDAVKDVTDYDSWFDHNVHRYEVGYYGFLYNRGYDPYISISADFSHEYSSYTGKKKEIDPNVWQWDTGDRLEADKAVAVIEHYKNDRLATIENLKASKNKYAAYLRLARKAEAIMKEMDGYDYEICEFAKEKALRQYSHYSYFWKGN